jgi:DNA modification methylase
VDFAIADPPYGIGKATWDDKYPEASSMNCANRERLRDTPDKKISLLYQRAWRSYKGLVSAWNINA